ncbi:C4-dicarboxylate transporter DcuC [Campylobacter sp. CCUG 57310]|uniref:C4-dicarboxylate transporter DcuC n=1 Tax=Campylobacter sp. CCUG 57310 TaxID=2517362 RepID=UPI001564B6E2|nr:C4-dicarboxylate transporter DcuC [Campylobacter sp. CCUG 57310]QKF91772.1 C4-dicarboxylate transporter, DcuC family [Campylobacter sp. CCUG 57310]
MATFKLICAVLGLVAVVYLLIKKRETKTVLIGVGLTLCVICLTPLDALAQFTKSMTSAGLIKAICASMGFAYVMKVTKCDQHLVVLLTKPMKNIGFLLVPITFVITFFVNIAIPSAAGCSAAVGATMIPLLMASGVRPAMAGAAVFAGTFGGVLSPGSAHNAYVSEMAKVTIPDVIKVQFPNAMAAFIVVLVILSITALLFKDYQKGQDFSHKANDGAAAEPIKVNLLYALMPLVPLVILIIGGTDLHKISFLTWTKMGVAEAMLHKISFLTWTKMGVAEAMLLGAILAVFVTWTSPEKITTEFFKGMGSAYAEVIGIIIAAGVFVAGLRACGAIDAITEVLKHSEEFVRLGGTFIPYLMAVVTGSGDAATMAFNGAITVHAQDLGFEQTKLGMAAAIAGALGRSSSPIAGAAIVCAGLAMVSPVEIAKRTAPAMAVAVCIIAFFMI